MPKIVYECEHCQARFVYKTDCIKHEEWCDTLSGIEEWSKKCRLKRNKKRKA